MTGTRSAVGLILWCAVTFGAAAAGAQFMPGAWYASLVKPSWTPPPFVFGPVWTVLYTLMAIAAWLVWRRAGFGGARAALTAFGVQLALNALWSYLFFGLHKPGLALLEIAALWMAILLTLVLFWRVDRSAGALLIPYLAWVSVATSLNAVLWWLNRGDAQQ